MQTIFIFEDAFCLCLWGYEDILVYEDDPHSRTSAPTVYACSEEVLNFILLYVACCDGSVGGGGRVGYSGALASSFAYSVGALFRE